MSADLHRVVAFLAFWKLRLQTHTLYGSFGSDVSVTLKVTLDLSTPHRVRSGSGHTARAIPRRCVPRAFLKTRALTSGPAATAGRLTGRRASAGDAGLLRGRGWGGCGVGEWWAGGAAGAAGVRLAPRLGVHRGAGAAALGTPGLAGFCSPGFLQPVSSPSWLDRCKRERVYDTRRAKHWSAFRERVPTYAAFLVEPNTCYADYNGQDCRAEGRRPENRQRTPSRPIVVIAGISDMYVTHARVATLPKWGSSDWGCPGST